MTIVVFPFLALYTAVFLLLAGIGLLGTYLPLQLTLAGVPAQTIGLVTSSYFAGMLVGAFQCHRLVQSVGHIRSFAAFAALVTAVVMLHGLYMEPLFWGILRFLAGIATIGLYMVIESWLNECSQPQLRGKVLAMYMVMSYLGMGVGQQLLNLGNSYSLPLFYLVGLLLALCLVPITLTHSIYPQLPAVERINAFELFRKAPTGMLGCVCAGLLSSAFYAIGPVFCHQIGLSVPQLTTVMTATIFGGMALQWPIGTVSDRCDRTYVLIFLGFMVMVLGIVIFFFAATSYGVLLVLMAVFGGMTFTLYPVAVARAHDIFEPGDIVAVSSVLLFSYGTGATAGPLLASMVMASLGSAYGLFAFCSLVGGSYALLTLFLRSQKIITVVEPEDNSDFVLLKSSSPVAANIIAPDEEEIAVAERADTGQEAE